SAGEAVERALAGRAVVAHEALRARGAVRAREHAGAGLVARVVRHRSAVDVRRAAIRRRLAADRRAEHVPTVLEEEARAVDVAALGVVRHDLRLAGAVARVATARAALADGR